MWSYSLQDNVLLENEGMNLEYRSVSKGISSSVWDTYSSFANTFGGYIILGVNCDTHEVEGVPDAESLINEIWGSLNDPQVVNRNILQEKHVTVVEIEGRQVICIEVPRADRYLRPICHRCVETGTFKRNGAEDIVCRLPEVAAMLRDSRDICYDYTLLDGTSFEDIDMDSFHSYRDRLVAHLPNHPWNSDDDGTFAEKIGVLSTEHGSRCLTVAGLLMFGKEHRIYRHFPDLKLGYREYGGSDMSCDFHMVSGSGLWTGNLYTFFNIVHERLIVKPEEDLTTGSDLQRFEDTEQYKAVRECVLNSLIHADYYGSVTVDIEYSPSGISVMNSGLFRIPLDKAEQGGHSDPRNKTLSKMFGLIGFVERAGLGVRYTREVWKSKWGVYPIIIEDVDGQKVIVKLPTVCDEPLSDTESSILSLLMEDPHLSIVRISKTLGVSAGVVSNSLNNMRSIGIIERIGGTRGYWAINPKKRQ